MNIESSPGVAGRVILAVVILITLVVALVGSGLARAAVGPTDLALTKSDSADPAVQGQDFAYTIQARNLGANDASGVVVTDVLPSAVDYVSSSATAGSCDRAGNTVTCDLGQINAGAVATATITVKAKKTGTTSNTASLTSADDTSAANDQDTESTVIAKKATGKPPKQPKSASCAAPTIAGTAGNDTLVGTAGPDVLRGFAGADRVFGGGGADLICVNLGADFVSGGTGADTIVGGPGRDRLLGSGSGDLIKGNTGRDVLRGQRGNDALNGGRNRDSCKGGAGRDALTRCP